VLAVSQNQPVMVGIKGVKTSHFIERKTNGGRKSQCEPLIAGIAAKVEVGLSAQRIY
jgi:hypothetical protein